MPAPDPLPQLPLTPQERVLVEALIATRARVAHRFALLSGLLTLGFLVRTALRIAARSGRATPTLVAVEIAVVAVVLALVWHFGFRPLAAMRRDAAGGMKAIVEGEVSALSRIDNAYGETITRATIAGVKLMTKGTLFAGSKPGDRVRVTFLPGARLALSVEPPT